MEKEPRVFLLHILNSISSIHSYLEVIEKEEAFFSARRFIRNLQIIDEATK